VASKGEISEIQRKNEAAAKIQKIQRGKAVRKKINTTVPQSDPDNKQRSRVGFTSGRLSDSERRVESRETDFGKSQTRPPSTTSAAGTLNNTNIDQFSNFLKKDGYFTAKYPETAEALLSSPRGLSAPKQTQETLLMTTGVKQYQSSHSNYKYVQWYARKSNAIFTRKKESNFVCPVQPEGGGLVLVPKQRSFRTNGIFPDPPLSEF